MRPQACDHNEGAHRPEECENHKLAHKFPFVAAEILTCSKTVSSALIEGGSLVKEDEGSDEEKKSQDDADDVNKIVRDSLNETNVS